MDNWFVEIIGNSLFFFSNNLISDDGEPTILAIATPRKPYPSAEINIYRECPPEYRERIFDESVLYIKSLK